MSLPVAVEQREGDGDQIRSRVADVCTRLNRAHAELVTLIGQLIDTDGWAGVGIRSPRHWLIVYAGLSPARAREIVRLAARRDQLPETVQAMADGRLSLDQSAVIARYVPATHSADATEFATLATVPQLRRSLSRYAFTDPTGTSSSGATGAGLDDDPDDDVDDVDADRGAAHLGAQEAQADQPDQPVADGMPDTGPDPWTESPRLSMGTQDGRFQLRFSASASVGALVERAIREAKDALFTAGQTDATLADGLVEVANRSLSTVSGTARADKYRVYVHLDTRGGWIGTGGGLPAHQLERIVCDGVVHPIWETAGTPVNVGRAMRIVPSSTRRLIEARDQGCRYPGCTATSPLDNHHLTSWRRGGVTDPANLVSLCPYHHDRLHDGHYTVTGTPTTPGGLRFLSPGGWPIAPVSGSRPSPQLSHPRPPGQPPEPGPPAWTGPTGERLHTRWLHIAPNPDNGESALGPDEPPAGELAGSLRQ